MKPLAALMRISKRCEGTNLCCLTNLSMWRLLMVSSKAWLSLSLNKCLRLSHSPIPKLCCVADFLCRRICWLPLFDLFTVNSSTQPHFSNTVFWGFSLFANIIVLLVRVVPHLGNSENTGKLSCSCVSNSALLVIDKKTSN